MPFGVGFHKLLAEMFADSAACADGIGDEFSRKCADAHGRVDFFADDLLQLLFRIIGACDAPN